MKAGSRGTGKGATAAAVGVRRGGGRGLTSPPGPGGRSVDHCGLGTGRGPDRPAGPAPGAVGAACKVWLEVGEATFGDGLYRLLRLVEGEGSIQGAARRLGMSYREAWGRIRTAECRMGIRLLEARAGGRAGGGAWLTEAARGLLEGYGRLRGDLDRALASALARHFGALLSGGRGRCFVAERYAGASISNPQEGRPSAGRRGQARRRTGTGRRRSRAGDRDRPDRRHPRAGHRAVAHRGPARRSPDRGASGRDGGGL
ncbi:MAG: LysR family transcriptional regulator [Acetobacteraceae bacterium]|nr:LysR family transcriptional regulator [Acetobacteraceae bacterium]